MLSRFFRWLTQPGLKERIRALEKRQEEIEYDWNDWYQKFRTLHARLAKQSVRAAERDAGGGEDGGPDREAGVGEDQVGGVRAFRPTAVTSTAHLSRRFREG